MYYCVKEISKSNNFFKFHSFVDIKHRNIYLKIIKYFTLGISKEYTIYTNINEQYQIKKFSIKFIYNLVIYNYKSKGIVIWNK